MELSNRTYDILKNIALVILPALATLVLTLSGIWNFPLGESIAASITAVDVFLGALLKISSATYNINQKNTIEDIDEDHKPHKG